MSGEIGSSIVQEEQQRQQQQQQVPSQPLWWQEESSVLPPWLKEYAAWHRDQVASLTSENWHARKYFIAFRCMKRFAYDNQCGGTADRLASTPVKLWYAARWKRIFLQEWDRPAPLEAFLLPPPDGLNWTVPSFIKPYLSYHGSNSISMNASRPSLLAASRSNLPFVYTREAFGKDKGVFHYNKELRKSNDEPSLEQFYRQAWDLMYRPVPEIQQLVERIMSQHGLVEGMFNALHFRSLYLGNDGKPELIEPAVNCALSFAPRMNRTLYVATDDKRATGMALGAIRARGSSRPVVMLRSNRTMLHLDRGYAFLDAAGKKDQYGNPSAYYDTFVDLFVISKARCIAYGRGSYGQWANLLSIDPYCYIHFFNDQKREYDFPPVCTEKTKFVL